MPSQKREGYWSTLVVPEVAESVGTLPPQSSGRQGFAYLGVWSHTGPVKAPFILNLHPPEWPLVSLSVGCPVLCGRKLDH